MTADCCCYPTIIKPNRIFNEATPLKPNWFLGINLDGWQPGTTPLEDTRAFGYLLEGLKDMPTGDYYVRVLLHKYETFHLKTGHTVKLEHSSNQYL